MILARTLIAHSTGTNTKGEEFNYLMLALIPEEAVPGTVPEPDDPVLVFDAWDQIVTMMRAMVSVGERTEFPDSMPAAIKVFMSMSGGDAPIKGLTKHGEEG